MKILAISDPHEHRKDFPLIKKKAREVDLILLAGDFTFFGKDLKPILNNFDSLARPVLLIPGNHEDAEVVKEEAKNYENIFDINGTMYESDNLTVLAYEGNGFARRDEDFEEHVKHYIALIEKKRRKLGNRFVFILMTHAPPYGTALDLIWGDDHSGNKSIRDFIENTQPDYAISGHIHETFGKEDKIGKTIVINPGPTGKILEINNNLK